MTVEREIRGGSGAVQAATIETPAGRFSVLCAEGTIAAAGFAPIAALAERLGGPEVRERRDLGPVTRALSAYFDGDVGAIDDLPVDQPGGEFYQATWKVMRDVPAGKTISYAELADRAGRPNAVRAAGSACARNLVALVVPCHRVRRTGGRLGGYYYGLPAKEWLLAHEQRSGLR
jgi:methylated-DNA-[protein]-cysteine S-methyltransferase